MTAPHRRLDKRAERRNHLVKVTLGVAPLVALLAAQAFGADGRAIEVLITVAVSWVLCAVVIALVMPMMTRRRRILAERILAAHPDAAVVTGFASKGTREHARALAG